jgi:hypothetical protein
VVPHDAASSSCFLEERTIGASDGLLRPGAVEKVAGACIDAQQSNQCAGILESILRIRCYSCSAAPIHFGQLGSEYEEPIASIRFPVSQAPARYPRPSEHREPCDSRGSCTVLERPGVKFLRAIRRLHSCRAPPVTVALPVLAAGAGQFTHSCRRRAHSSPHAGAGANHPACMAICEPEGERGHDDPDAVCKCWPGRVAKR